MLIVHNTQRRDPNRPAIKKNKNAGGSGHLTRTDGKTYCLDSGNTNAIELVGCIKFGRTDEAKKIRKESMKNGKDYTPFQAKEITSIDYDKMNTLTTAISKDNLLMQLAVEIKYQKEIEKSLSNEKATTIDASYYKGFGVRNGACRQVVQVSENNKSNGGTQPYQQDRIYDVNGISPALSKGKSDLLITGPNDSQHITSRIRRLTPLECMRLQTMSDTYLMPVSDSQRYKQLGNGWTIEVISHILNYIK
jgi:site-specific DNA-cytosine methylase